MQRLFRFLILSLLALQGRAYDDYYSDYDDDAFFQSVNTCQNSIVQVTSIQVVCNSPRTYYYGSSANRKSATCDYGDKASVTVNFNVASTASTDIYAVMAVNTNNGEELYQSYPKSLCDNFVGYACTNKGYYSFTAEIQFAYLDGDDSGFSPVVQMAFSSYTDGGTDYGGVNVNSCYADEEEDGSSSNFFDFTESTEKDPKGIAAIALDWGILTGVVAAVVIFIVVLLKRGKADVQKDVENVEEDSHNFELM